MKMFYNLPLLLFAISLSSTLPVKAARILLFPFNHGSHINFFTVIGSALKEAGHDVYIIASERYAGRVPDHSGTLLCPNWTSDVNIMDEYVIKKGVSNPFELVPVMLSVFKQQIRETMADKSVMNKLNDMDLVLVDGAINKFVYFMPYKLSVPYISISAFPDPWSIRVPASPAVEGMIPFLYLTEDSNIFHRCASTLSHLFINAFLHFVSPFFIAQNELFSELVPEKPNVGLNELYLRSEMFLIVIDNICLDAHRVSAPHYQYVGGIAAKPAKPLPEDINKFVTKAPHGVVLIAFGSEFKVMPDDMLQKMIPAFGHSKLSFILKHSGNMPDNMPSNVFLSSWLPQNDILGHPKTRLFVTHAGNNGQLEAVYHGVPMLMMPFFGDQHYNAYRAEVRGYGKALSPHHFTAQEFETTLNELTVNNTYYDNIQKCSRIHKHLPSGQQSVAFWVDHILKFGGSHLKPYYLRMPLWKFLMMDVLCVFVIGIISSVYCTKWCCVRFCCRKKGLVKHHKAD